MAIEFEDGFESGDTSAWTGTGSSGTSTTQSVQSGSAHAGTYKLREVANSSSDSSDQAYVYKDSLTIPTTGAWGMDFAFRWTANTQIGYAGTGAKSPIKVIGGANDLFWLPVVEEIGFAAAYKDNSFSIQQLGAGTTGALTQNTWYILRIRVANPNVVAKTADLYFDISSDSGANFTNVTSDTGIDVRLAWADDVIDEFRIGHNHISSFEKAQYTWEIDQVKAWTTTAPTYGAATTVKHRMLLTGVGM